VYPIPMPEPRLFGVLRKLGIGAPLREGAMALLRLVKGNYMRVTIDDHPFTVDLRDKIVSFMILFYREYDVEEATVLRRLIRPGDRVVDVGAHIGYYSVLLGLGTGTGGRVLSLEPHPDNNACLARNVADNALEGVVRIERVAAGAASGEATLFESGRNRGDNRMYSSDDLPTRSFSVPVRAVDDLVADWDRVDLIKMDIQGFEPAAILGMRETLSRNAGIILLTEFWPYGIKQAGSEPQAMLETLLSFDFELYEIRADGLARVDPDDLMRRLQGQIWANLVCARAGVLEARGVLDAPPPLARNEQKTEYGAKRIVDAALSRLGNLGRVLDVGCGTGQVLRAATPYASSLTGVDLDAGALDRARLAVPGATFLTAGIENLPFEPGSFDTIFFCDVIEHLRNPLDPLDSLRRLLARDGVLVVTTPNANAVTRLVLGDAWFGLSDESHLLFFTAFTLGHALRKSGFEKISLRTFGGTGQRALDFVFELLRTGGTLVACARA